MNVGATLALAVAANSLANTVLANRQRNEVPVKKVVLASSPAPLPIAPAFDREAVVKRIEKKQQRFS